MAASLLTVELNCTFPHTSQAICKRYFESRNSTAHTKADASVIEYLDTIAERHVALLPHFQFGTRVYSALLLCQNYGATLCDVESRSELALLRKLIGESFRSDGLSTGAAYFVDLHRYFTISMIVIGAVL